VAIREEWPGEPVMARRAFHVIDIAKIVVR
jgi:hypothetical protein